MKASPADSRWRVALLLCLSTALSNLDRQALAVVAPVLLVALSLDKVQYGLIAGAFLLSYGLGQIFAGAVVDRVGTRRSLSWAVPLWSAAAAAHSAATGFVGLLFARAALGAVEAANYPAAFKAVAELFPAHERSLATGIVTAGTGLGAMIAPPLVGTVAYAFGWEMAFLVPAALGGAWLVAWRAIHRRVPVTPIRDVSAASPRVAGEAATDIARALRDPVARILMASRFLADGGVYFLLLWLPQYLSEQRGFDLRQIALYAWIPFVASDLGNLGGGWVGTILMNRGHSLRTARLALIWGGAVLTVAAAATPWSQDAANAIALICVGTFGIQVRTAGLFALPTDLVERRHVATVWGLSGAAGSIGAALCQPLVGWATEAHGFTPVFVVVPAMQLVAAACVTFLIPSHRFEGR